MDDQGEDPTEPQVGDSVELLLAKGRARYERPPHRAILASAPSFFIPPPFGWRHPVTGKRGWQPSFELIAFGMYVKRARYLVDLTQHRLERVSGISQGHISRLERALAPWTKTEDLVMIGKALGRAFPLGFCPHEHPCQWQPAPTPPTQDLWDELSPMVPDYLRRRAAEIAEAEGEGEE